MLLAGIRNDWRYLRWRAWSALWRGALWVYVRAWAKAALLEEWVDLDVDLDGREN